MKFLILALLPAAALGQLLGGITDATVDPNSVPVRFALQEANKYLATSTGLGDSFQALQLVEVVKARTQVVAGMNYFLTLRLAQDYVCNVTVWYRPWLSEEQQLQVTDGPICSKAHAASVRALGGLAGGVSQRHSLPNLGDTDQGDMALKALQNVPCLYSAESNNMFVSILGDTSGVTYTEQVTAGMTYRFYNVPLVDSSCRNNGCPDDLLSSCHVRNGGMKATCDLVIQSEPWMDVPYILTSINCSS